MLRYVTFIGKLIRKQQLLQKQQLCNKYILYH